MYKLTKAQWKSPFLVLVIAAIGLLINAISIPLYSSMFGFEEWGIISLDFVYFNFFCYFGAFAMNIYLFHSKGDVDKILSARIIYLLWLTLNFIGFTFFWPCSGLERLSYIQLGLLSSLAIYKSGMEWQEDRFISQRLWLLMPILVFHSFTVIIRLQLIQLTCMRSIVLGISTLFLIYLLSIYSKNRKSINKHSKEILIFTVPMIFNLLLTAGVELEMKDTLQSVLKELEWSVFSLGLFVYAFHGLLGNNLSPIANSWIKKNISNLGSLWRVLLKVMFGIALILLLGHIAQIFFISMFNIWYLVYSVSILLWLASNLLSVQLLNSKIIVLFGIVQIVIYLLFRAEFSVAYYILTHFLAALVAFIFALYTLLKTNRISMIINETE